MPDWPRGQLAWGCYRVRGWQDACSRFTGATGMPGIASGSARRLSRPWFDRRHDIRKMRRSTAPPGPRASPNGAKVPGPVHCRHRWGQISVPTSYKTQAYGGYALAGSAVDGRVPRVLSSQRRWCRTAEGPSTAVAAAPAPAGTMAAFGVERLAGAAAQRYINRAACCPPPPLPAPTLQPSLIHPKHSEH